MASRQDRIFFIDFSAKSGQPKGNDSILWPDKLSAKMFKHLLSSGGFILGLLAGFASGCCSW
jgi:hypothetical protein